MDNVLSILWDENNPPNSRFDKWDKPLGSDTKKQLEEQFRLQLKNAEYEAHLRRILEHLKSLRVRTSIMAAVISELNAENKNLRQELQRLT